jgi:ABC-type dipeptide/oligopeptide/nickel transport system permease subunit
MLHDAQDAGSIAYYLWLPIPAALVIATVLALSFPRDGSCDAADPYIR